MSQVQPRVYVSRFSKQTFWVRSPRVLRDQTHGGIIEIDHGHAIQFHNNKFVTSDPTEIAYLDGCLGPELMVLEPREIEVRTEPEAVSTAPATAVAKGTERTQYPCRECGRVFQKPQHLALHFRTHTKGRWRAGARAEGEALTASPG